MKIAVLLSGGVDSSVALRLAQQAGCRDLTAFYLKIWLEDELAHLGRCPWEEDLRFARAVCAQAGVPLEVVSLQTEYHERVVMAAVEELRAGRTPSPDIWCNQRIKFGLFLDKIEASFDKVVSGHYAQVAERRGASLTAEDVEPLADSQAESTGAGSPRPQRAVTARGKETGQGLQPSSVEFVLKRSPDPVKDQTYFLHALTQTQLRRLWFPLGHLRKSEVRQLAGRFDLPNRDRPDSQGICFLGKIKYAEFVRHHLGEQPGEIVEIETGRPLAGHRGHWFYTIGQRKNLGLPGGPWYVVKKDVATNRVFVSHADRCGAHARDRFTVSAVNWIAGEPARSDLQTKVRHSPHWVEGRIEPRGAGRWDVTLKTKDQGIAPGQSAVFYDGDICLGGGVIE